jgi:4-amino-4-deoxy-L-arabinose transferase-like glycosyltransferase
VLRLVGLGSTIRTLVDEVHWINGIQHLWWHPNDGLLTSGSTFLPTTLVYSYWEASAVSLFGRNFFGLRVVSAVVGTLNIWALYLLARALFDRTTALAAALVLATFPPHLHFSRIAMAHVGDTLFGTLALAFAARGLRENRRLDWALCGAALGLTQYFYEGGRLLFPPLLIAWLLVLAVTTRGHLRAQRRGIGVALVTALIVAAPVYLVIVSQHAPLTNRMNDAGIGLDYWVRFLSGQLTAKEQGDLVLRLTVPFQVFVHLPEQAIYYGGKTAMILPLLVPLALLGLGYVVWRWRTPAILVLLWILATAVGNIMLRDNGQFPRFVVVFPALALLIALGVRAALGLLTAHLPAPARLSVLALLLALIGAMQVGYYFFVHLPLYNTQIREAKLYPDGTDAVLRSLDLPADTQLILIGDPTPDQNVPRTLLGFLVPSTTDAPLVTMNAGEVTDAYLATLPHDHSYAFFVQFGHPDVLARIETFFKLDPPEISPFREVPPDRMFVLYYARRDR